MAHVLPAQVSLSGSSFAENPAENLEESVRKRKRGVDPTAAAAADCIFTVYMQAPYILTIYIEARAHYNILWILTVEENAGKAVVENLALSWALLLRPLLLGVTLLESSRVNLIKVG